MTGRRTTGEGTVYLRKDGRWEGAAYVPTVSGGRRRIRVYGKSRQEAQSQLTAKLAATDRGVAFADRSWTIGSYLDYWMRDIAPQDLRPRTIEGYESTIRNHIKPRLGTKSLATLSVTELQQILNQQLREGHSASTVANTRKVLSAALTAAMREDVVMRNVARVVKLPTVEPKEITPWIAAEATRFLNVARLERLYPAFLLLALYGMRRGEVLGLRWSDVDWDQNELRVRQQLQQIGGKLQVGPVKTKAGKRDLPLLTSVREALSRLQAAAETIETTSDLVFLSEDGTPIWPRNFVRTFHHIRERAGLRRIKLHHLRHTAATLLKDVGVPARDAQLILGHASIVTTQQLYQHGDVATKKAALDRVGRVLLLSGDNGGRSRQNQPSIAEIVVGNTSIISGGPGGARTLDTLLKRNPGRGEEASFTSVIAQLQAFTSTCVLGYVAVKWSRQMH